MAKKKHPAFAVSVPVSIRAAEGDEEEKKGPPEFDVMAYTGVQMNINGYDLPLVVDQEGISFGKSLVANLDHDSSKRVGHVTGKEITPEGVRFTGKASASTEAKREVVESAKEGFVWQASIEAYPEQLEEVPDGEEVEVNGRSFTGPLYVARKAKLVGFAFVSHGADDNTTVAIAAKAASHKERIMDAKFKAWIEEMGVDAESASPELLATLQANYDGKQGAKKGKTTLKLDDIMAAKQAEVERVELITEIAAQAGDARPYDIDSIKAIAAQAIDDKWTVEKFRLALFEASVPPAGVIIHVTSRSKLTNEVLEAAVCMAGRLGDVEKRYSPQVLEAADKRFKHGIGLKELLVTAAQANGYNNGGGYSVSQETLRAAFGMTGPQQIRAAGFSTISLPNVLSNTANKFIREGWNHVDQTPLRIAAIRSVNDFKQITTVSLTGGLSFDKVGADGEIKHGTVSELTYTNQADTYARMLAITRRDIINDDLGALTSVPKRLGRGAMLKLNEIFWTEFLNNSSFFTSGNSNVNEGVADMTVGGLEATEVIFMNQTDPDGNPLGAMPAILLVPTALKAKAIALMDTQSKLITGASSTLSDVNVFAGRFRVESSPYMSNSSYTGYSAQAWYMLADPNDIPVIEIAALNGKVEPTVETVDADVNVLGIQMRGYSDIGVNLQEYRGGVRADGGAS